MREVWQVEERWQPRWATPYPVTVRAYPRYDAAFRAARYSGEEWPADKQCQRSYGSNDGGTSAAPLPQSTLGVVPIV
jgi:hypothetical protein